MPTPTELATDKLKAFVQGDATLGKRLRDAVVADLEGERPAGLAALQQVLGGDIDDEDDSAEGEQPAGDPA